MSLGRMGGFPLSSGPRSIRRGLGIIWLLALQMIFVGLYLEGIRSLIRRFFVQPARHGDPDWPSVAAGTVLILFAFAWKKDYRLGLATQLVALALIVGWAAKMEPSILRSWVAYAPPVAAAVIAMAAIVSAILWIVRRSASNKNSDAGSAR